MTAMDGLNAENAGAFFGDGQNGPVCRSTGVPNASGHFPRPYGSKCRSNFWHSTRLKVCLVHWRSRRPCGAECQRIFRRWPTGMHFCTQLACTYRFIANKRYNAGLFARQGALRLYRETPCAFLAEACTSRASVMRIPRQDPHVRADSSRYSQAWWVPRYNRARSIGVCP